MTTWADATVRSAKANVDFTIFYTWMSIASVVDKAPEQLSDLGIG